MKYQHDKFPFVEIILFFFSAAFAIFRNVQTEYIQFRVCRQLAESDHTIVTSTSHGFCMSDGVSSLASQWSMYVSIANVVPACLTSTIFGTLSDKYGRKSFLLMSLATAVLTMCFHTLVVVYDWPLYSILVVYGLWGLTGSYPLILMAVFSGLIDVVRPDQRTLRIGVLEGLLCGGLFIGGFVGGIITDNYGYAMTFNAVVALSAIATFFSIAMPETLKPENKRSEVAWKEANLVAATITLAKNRTIGFVSLAFVLGVIAFIGPASVWVLFGNLKFDWDDDMIGYFTSTDRGTRAFALLFILPFIQYLPSNSMFRSDQFLAVMGFSVQTIQFVMYGVVSTTTAMFGLTGLGPLAGIAVPVLRSMASKCFPPMHQGKVMSALASVESLTGLIGPLLFNNVYSATVTGFSGTFTIVAGGLAFLCVICILFTRKRDMSLDNSNDAEHKHLLQQPDSDNLDFI